MTDQKQTSQGLPPGWTLRDYGHCRSQNCGADVLWATNDVTKKTSPFNPDGISHFATCPDAQKWRKR